VNGWVVDMLRRHGRAAPMNELAVKLGFEIEAGKRMASTDNAGVLIETYQQIHE